MKRPCGAEVRVDYSFHADAGCVWPSLRVTWCHLFGTRRNPPGRFGGRGGLFIDSFIKGCRGNYPRHERIPGAHRSTSGGNLRSRPTNLSFPDTIWGAYHVHSHFLMYLYGWFLGYTIWDWGFHGVEVVGVVMVFNVLFTCRPMANVSEEFRP